MRTDLLLRLIKWMEKPLAMIIVYIVPLCLILAFWVTVIWVGAHFVIKYW